MLHAADFMIHSSHVEGVPIAILYGMSAALPIVVSDVGGVYEVIHQNETGVRVPENAVEQFAGEVIALIEDPHRRSALGARAREFVTTAYSIETACSRVQQTYKEVLGW
jgi:glycosyltransferase involved in cell wall biosynthesis